MTTDALPLCAAGTGSMGSAGTSSVEPGRPTPCGDLARLARAGRGRHRMPTLINPKVAAEQLGHASAALTLDRYTHVSTAQRHQAAAAVDALLQTVGRT